MLASSVSLDGGPPEPPPKRKKTSKSKDSDATEPSAPPAEAARPLKRKKSSKSKDGDATEPSAPKAKRARVSTAAPFVEDTTPLTPGAPAAALFSAPVEPVLSLPSRKRSREDATPDDDVEDTQAPKRSLINVGAIQKESSMKHFNTVKNHLRTYFLEYSKEDNLDEPVRERLLIGDVDELLLEDISEDLFGKFAFFLMEARLSHQTIVNYLSSLKNHLLSKHPTLRSTIFSHDPSSFMSKLSHRVKQACVDRSVAENIPLQEGAPSALTDDLLHIAKECISNGNWESFQHRCFFIWLFHLLGRTSEMVRITYDDIDVNAAYGCLTVSYCCLMSCGFVH